MYIEIIARDGKVNFSSWIISGLCLMYDVIGCNCVTRFIKQDTFNVQDFENKQAVKTSKRKHSDIPRQPNAQAPPKLSFKSNSGKTQPA